MDAWDLTIRGEFQSSKYTQEELLAGIELFTQARTIEPEFSPPIAGAAVSWLILYFLGWREDGINPFQLGVRDAKTAHRLDPNNYRALTAMAIAECVDGRPEEGVALAIRMIELNPFGAFGYHWLGLGFCSLGDREKAVEAQTEAWRLCRHEPWHFDTANDLAWSHYFAGNYEAAIEWGLECLKLLEFLQSRIVLAAAYAQLDRVNEAHPHVEAVLTARPDFSLDRFRSHIVYVKDEDRDHLVEGLMKAGLSA